MIKRILAVLALTASAFGAQYTIDPVHSSATFRVRHMMISNVSGRFSSGVSGTIDYDDADPTKSSVSAVIKTASIDTDNEYRDKDLRSENFFDTDKYPEMTFKSTKIEKRGDQWVAIGTLTIKDVSKQIELPFELNKLQTPRGTMIGVTASTTINRKDYHINWSKTLDGGGAVVADQVKIELSLEAKPGQPGGQMSPPPAKK